MKTRKLTTNEHVLLAGRLQDIAHTVQLCLCDVSKAFGTSSRAARALTRMDRDIALVRSECDEQFARSASPREFDAAGGGRLYYSGEHPIYKCPHLSYLEQAMMQYDTINAERMVTLQRLCHVTGEDDDATEDEIAELVRQKFFEESESEQGRDFLRGEIKGE